LGSPPLVFSLLCVPGSTLARHLSSVGIHSAQRNAPPLTLVHAQRLQRLGLCVLQRRRLFNRSWYAIYNFHAILDRTQQRPACSLCQANQRRLCVLRYPI
jgi:hypothetical protein